MGVNEVVSHLATVSFAGVNVILDDCVPAPTVMMVRASTASENENESESGNESGDRRAGWSGPTANGGDIDVLVESGTEHDLAPIGTDHAPLAAVRWEGARVGRALAPTSSSVAA